MATPVSGNMSKLAASGAAFNADTFRGGAGTAGSFSDLLRGQIQAANDTPAPTPAASTARVRQPDRTSMREPSHAFAPTPSTRQEPTHDVPSADEKPQDGAAVPADGAPCETGAPPDDTVADDALPVLAETPIQANDVVPVPAETPIQAADVVPVPAETPIQAADAVVTPVLPATIAAPPEALADADGPAAEEPDIETPPRNAKRHGHALTASGTGTGTGTNPAESGTSAKTTASRAEAAITASQTTNLPGSQADALAARAGMGAQTAPPDASLASAPMPNALRTPTQESAALPRFAIPAATGQRAWAEEAGNKIMWMLGRAESRAELILTPPHLGKVEVSINLNGDQTTAQFLASSQAAREALEQAMPRLRELLAQAGIDLGNASVDTSAEGRTQDGDTARATRRASPGGASNDDGNDNAAGVTSANRTRLDNGLIDTFA
ncbi:MAG: flagellar hook-length control protein FliK [Azoarcus sp.]|jgi:flagellar hook-length control protein FliK|nr:flagellar hook-length control protein FliK [Azoarcus sp.]